MSQYAATSARASSLRILASALMSALFVIGLALWFVLVPADGLFVPPYWLLGGQVAAGVVVHLVIEAVGYRSPALQPGLPPEQVRGVALTRYQSLMIVRFALAESIAILSIAATFVAMSGWLGFVSGAAVSLLLMAYHVWPWRRPIDRTAASLERAGGTSWLRTSFGMPERLGGAIREL